SSTSTCVSQGALSVVNCVATYCYLSYLSTIPHWLGQRGLSPAVAEQFVPSMYLGVGSTLDDSEQPPADLVRAHETPEGINETVRRSLVDPQNQAHLEQALAHVLRRISPPQQHQS